MVAREQPKVVREQPVMARARWYWQEDGGNIGKHNPSDVLQPGNFVAYAGSVCIELDSHWDRRVKAVLMNARVTGLDQVDVDLADRIGSTGTEQKAHNAHTGTVFQIDFTRMKQVNKKSGFARDVKRVEHTAAVEAPEGAPEASSFNLLESAQAAIGRQVFGQSPKANDQLVDKVRTQLGLSERDDVSVAREAAAQLGVDTSGSSTSEILVKCEALLFGTSSGGSGPGGAAPRVQRVIKDGLKPAEAADEDMLACFPGQLLQTSKTLPNGWAYGSVVYDPTPDRTPLGIEGVSFTSGWFPMKQCTDLPTADQLGKLKELLGGNDSGDALAPPETWTPMKDPTACDFIPVDGAEKNEVSAAWKTPPTLTMPPQRSPEAGHLSPQP